MITAWMIYGIGILDGVKGFFAVMIFISALYLILIIFSTLQKKDMGGTETEDEKKKRNRLVAKVFSALVLFALLFSITPSTKLAAAMFVIPSIANNEKLQNIGKNTLNGLEKLTEQWLQELSEGDKKSQSVDKI